MKRTGYTERTFQRRRNQSPHANDAGLGITDDARRWIAENLLLGAAPDLIAARLQERGCPAALAQAEIAQAAASPYLQGANVLQQRLGKRDWLLGSYARLAASEGGLDGVPMAARLPADEFFRDYYAMHRPVLISGLMDEWPALSRWSLDYFEAEVGDADVEVQTRRESNPSYEIESPTHRERMKLSAILAMLREGRETNDFYVTAGNGGHNRQALARLWEDIGPIPGYLDRQAENDGFFWMGPKGTVTPFHHDLTNNLLVQVSGRKQVTLVPSWDTPKMRNFRHCYSGWSSPEELREAPEGGRPAVIECVMGPGEALFIPVGWWHHVMGLDATIGMSFTNFTRNNDFYSDYSFYDQV